MARPRPMLGKLCMWCHEPLTNLDALNFLECNLSMVWRNGTPYGACKACVEFQCFLEVYLHSEGDYRPREVAQEVGRSLCDVRVRCWSCSKPLTKNEKQEIELLGKPLTKVRHKEWRALCYNCGLPRHDREWLPVIEGDCSI
ncbi:E6 [Equus caballus papillomavirus 1]|uniref:Protein E6 n=3 Tax=Zetapapillomavirus 1 TaxID=333919 RepID=Q8QQC2_ECPVO|nr:E6 [Equus caballus papillomavirus 1]AAM19219.1 E6 [Equus caballus papillomavirus 1]AAN09894.1 putative transforming protein E6 [Zetapapillomavirus 1]ATL25015.1 E6 [Equus caballus papillomavirus 1]